MNNRQLEERALQLLRASPKMRTDAKQGVAISNTVAGGMLALMFDAPRWATEAAVRNALRKLNGQRKRKVRPANTGRASKARD